MNLNVKIADFGGNGPCSQGAPVPAFERIHFLDYLMIFIDF